MLRKVMMAVLKNQKSQQGDKKYGEEHLILLRKLPAQRQQLKNMLKRRGR
jgi:hypothetical protein